MAEGAYKGPRKNRRMLDDKTVFVSKEELADFKRRFGADKTLRDLLNADKTGKLPEAVKAAKAGPRRNVEAEAKGAETLERMKSRAERGMAVRSNEEMRDEAREKALGFGAAALGLAAGPVARAAMGSRASKTASMARTEPRVGRPVTSRLDDAEAAFSRPQARQVSKDTGYTREPLPEKKMPKERTQFRSRTADRRDEREMRMAKGGVAKKRK